MTAADLAALTTSTSRQVSDLYAVLDEPHPTLHLRLPLFSAEHTLDVLEIEGRHDELIAIDEHLFL